MRVQAQSLLCAGGKLFPWPDGAIISSLQRNWRNVSGLVRCLSCSRILCQYQHTWRTHWLWSSQTVTWTEASGINWQVKRRQKVSKEFQLAHSKRKYCISFLLLYSTLLQMEQLERTYTHLRVSMGQMAGHGLTASHHYPQPLEITNLPLSL